jgi:hypothetical protein
MVERARQIPFRTGRMSDVDPKPIYLNLDDAIWLRWNDEDNFTAVSWINGLTETIVRVRETPDEIFSKVASLGDV